MFVRSGEEISIHINREGKGPQRAGNSKLLLQELCAPWLGSLCSLHGLERTRGSVCLALSPPFPAATTSGWTARTARDPQRPSLHCPAPFSVPKTKPRGDGSAAAWAEHLEEFLQDPGGPWPWPARPLGMSCVCCSRENTGSGLGCAPQRQRAVTASAGTHGAQCPQAAGTLPGDPNSQPGDWGERGEREEESNQEPTLQCKTAFIAGGGQQGLGRGAGNGQGLHPGHSRESRAAAPGQSLGSGHQEPPGAAQAGQGQGTGASPAATRLPRRCSRGLLAHSVGSG